MAKPNEWGLTDAGFRRPTYAELLDALEYKARELFGSKANLTVPDLKCSLSFPRRNCRQAQRPPPTPGGSRCRL